MKKFVVLLAALLVVMSIAGCVSKDPEPKESAWEVFIGGDEVVFAIEDIKEMETVTIEAEKKDEVHSYTGVRLSVLLKKAKVEGFETLTLEADDGYSFDITTEEAMHENSILAFAMDGEDLSSEKTEPLMFVSTETSSKAWVGRLKYVRVGK